MPYTRNTGRARQFVAGTQAYQDVVLASTIIPYETTAITPGAYKISLNVDGGGAADITFNVDTSYTWEKIVEKIEAIAWTVGVAVELLEGRKIRFTSVTRGVTSSIVVADGSTAGFLAALTAAGYTNSIATTVAGTDDVGTAGYQTISNTGALGTFVGATVPAIASATYDLDVTIDGGSLNQLAIALLNTDSWTGILAKIQTALRTATSSTETVALVDGKIKVTSATTNEASAVLIAAGTAGSGGGDLLAAITALSADYTATVDTAVAGTSDVIFTINGEATVANPTRNYVFDVNVTTALGVDRTATAQWLYDRTAGILTVSDGTAAIADGDVIDVTFR